MRNMKPEYRAVYLILKKIPKGKATTYGAIAKKLGLNPRYVGRILSENEHPVEYPCYKVVRSDGIVGGYTIGSKNDDKTAGVKRKKLIADGVPLKGDRVERPAIITDL